MLEQVDRNLFLGGSNDQQALILELQKQVQLSTLIHQISQEFRKTLNLDEILQSACRLLSDALSCEQVYVLIAESGDRNLTVRGEYHRSPHATQLGKKRSIAVLPDLRLQMQVIPPDLESALGSLLQSAAGSQSAAGTQSAAGSQSAVETQAANRQFLLRMPIHQQGEISGMIELYRTDCLDQDEAITIGDLLWQQKVIEGIASQLSIAIEQARLYESTRRQAEREALLRLITNQIHQSLDLHTILQTAVQQVRQLLNTSRVVIYQFHENWQGTVMVEDVADERDAILGKNNQDDCFSGEYAHLYAAGRVQAIDDILQAGLDACHVNFLQGLQVRANLIVPIVIESKLWGLLLAHECRHPRVWQRWETDLLQQLATQLAIAIQQCNLYSQVQAAATQAQLQAEQLQATLKELQAMQLQLIQTEKLSSLGQMVAGIAHEINNATTFIHSNLPYAQNYAARLEQALSLYETNYPQPPQAIAELSDTADLSYIREDFPRLLQSMQDGTNRIRAIVLTLRNFSRLDQAQYKLVDLHEGLESTLVILQHRLKAGAQIHKQYGDLPLVECHAGQINQVFLNLLSNALDAAGEQAEVTIRTWQSSPDHVTIAVRDNGPGIPQDIQPRIFDPFFTTKPIGRGTGLGLSICQQIICHSHKGQIHCISQPGQGTEFQIELPIAIAVQDEG